MTNDPTKTDRQNSQDQADQTDHPVRYSLRSRYSADGRRDPIADQEAIRVRRKLGFTQPLDNYATPQCRSCYGLGHVDEAPCKCVYRRIAKDVLKKYRECRESGKINSRVSFCRTGSGPTNSGHWGRKEEEFCADVDIAVRRQLQGADRVLFRRYWIDGASSADLLVELRMSRGAFFHAVYALEEEMGRVFLGLLPYPIWPLNNYFHHHHIGGITSCLPQMATA